jgi:hypothetical protein
LLIRLASPFCARARIARSSPGLSVAALGTVRSEIGVPKAEDNSGVIGTNTTLNLDYCDFAAGSAKMECLPVSPCTTSSVIEPIRSNVIFTLSPGRIGPTPAGVPVAMMSPG